MHPGLPLSKWESQVQTREVACLLLRLLPLHFGTQKDASLGKPHPSLCNKSLSIQVLFFFFPVVPRVALTSLESQIHRNPPAFSLVSTGITSRHHHTWV